MNKLGIGVCALAALGPLVGCSADEDADATDGGFVLDGSLDGSTAVDASARDAANDGSSVSDSSTLPDASAPADAAAADASAPDASAALSKFSFFVTSLSAMRQLAKSPNGFGGNLSYGETGAGAGLRGADKICTEIAELSMPGAAAKQWRAFLSTKTPAVSAKSRIGNGPWYDRTGRLVAENLTNLLKERPQGAAAQIIDDLPNERGEPNKAGSAENGLNDNHDVVTASDAQGNFDNGNTCSDWTSVTSSGSGPGLGHSWPAMSGKSWIEAHPAHGCAAGVYLMQSGPGTGTGIGAGGGYGAIYCFALMP